MRTLCHENSTRDHLRLFYGRSNHQGDILSIPSSDYKPLTITLSACLKRIDDAGPTSPWALIKNVRRKQSHLQHNITILWFSQARTGFVTYQHVTPHAESSSGVPRMRWRILSSDAPITALLLTCIIICWDCFCNTQKIITIGIW